MTETAVLQSAPLQNASELAPLDEWIKNLETNNARYLTDLSLLDLFSERKKEGPQQLAECLQQLEESHNELRKSLNLFPRIPTLYEGTNPLQETTQKVGIEMKSLIGPLMEVRSLWEPDNKEFDVKKLSDQWNELLDQSDFSNHLRKKRQDYREAWMAIDLAVAMIRDRANSNKFHLKNKKNEMKKGWHKDTATPPPSHQFGPLEGDQDELAKVVAHSQAKQGGERTLQNKLENEPESYWGRKLKKGKYEIWFSSQEKYEECRSKLEEIRSRST